MVMGAILAVVGCGGGSSTVAETSDIPTEVEIAIDAPASKLSQELIDTLAYMGNEERLAYDVYNAFYEKYGTNVFTMIATNGEYQHITLVQELIQKYKLSDDVNFTNVDLDPLGYINTDIEDMQAGTYDIADIQELYDRLVKQGVSSEIEALKVGCIVEVVDINDLDRDIILAESENATDIVDVFNTLRNGSYNHYWSFDDVLKQRGEEGCCPLALTLGHTECPTIEDYPTSNR